MELVRQPGGRLRLDVSVRPRRNAVLACGRCGQRSPRHDRGSRDGWQRRWRHVDAGVATVDLIGDAPRVNCMAHGPTVAVLSWARHDSPFTRAFEDLVVHDAVVSNKHATAKRYAVSWRAVNNACVRVATEALGRVDLLDGLTAVAIDEVKYKKGQRNLTIVCGHHSGRVVWSAEGRSKAPVTAFFTALGPERAARLRFVSADGAECIHAVVAEHAPTTTLCLDTFHVLSWATGALDEVRRVEWNQLRDARHGCQRDERAAQGPKKKIVEIEIKITGRLRRSKGPKFVELSHRLEALRLKHEQGLLASDNLLKSLLELAKDFLEAEKEQPAGVVED